MTQSNSHRKPLTALFAVSAIVCLACTNQAPSGSSREVKAVKSPITSPCSQQTLGLPCDPDGDGDATECQGVCWLDADLRATCATLGSMGMKVTDLNGRVCGETVGQDCAHSCENGVCVAKNARLGTACRPTASLSSCDGLCTLFNGTPTCDQLHPARCADMVVTGCVLRACDFADNTATGCQDYTLAAGTTCSDGLACTTGDTCNASGACVPTTDNCGGAGGQGGAGGVSGGTAGKGGSPTAGTAGTTAGSAGAPKGGSAGATAGSAGAPKGGSAGTTAGSAGAPKGGSAGAIAGSAGAPKAGSAGAAKVGSPTGGTSGEVVILVPSSERTRITGGGCSTSPSRAPSAGYGMLMLLGLCGARRRR